MVVHARARAYVAHMGSRSNAVFANMRANAYAQDFNIRAGSVYGDRNEERKNPEGSSE